MDQPLSNPVGVHFVFESGHGKVMLDTSWSATESDMSRDLGLFFFFFFCGLSELTCHCAQQLGQLIGLITAIYIVQESRDICKTQSGNGY